MSVGSIGPRIMVSAVKMACTSTGNTRSAITILATIAPYTGSSARDSLGPVGRSRPLPGTTLAAVAATRSTGPHVHLLPIELVGDFAPLLKLVSQGFPVVTESVVPGSVSGHRYHPYSKW